MLLFYRALLRKPKIPIQFNFEFFLSGFHSFRVCFFIPCLFSNFQEEGGSCQFLNPELDNAWLKDKKHWSFVSSCSLVIRSLMSFLMSCSMVGFGKEIWTIELSYLRLWTSWARAPLLGPGQTWAENRLIKLQLSLIHCQHCDWFTHCHFYRGNTLLSMIPQSYNSFITVVSTFKVINVSHIVSSWLPL